MADMNGVYDALRKADAAGNTEDASRLSAYIKSSASAPKAPPSIPPSVSQQEPGLQGGIEQLPNAALDKTFNTDFFEKPTTGGLGGMGEAALSAASLAPGLGTAANIAERAVLPGIKAIGSRFAPEIGSMLKALQPKTVSELGKQTARFGVAGAAGEAAGQASDKLGGGKTSRQISELVGGALPGLAEGGIKAVSRPFLPGAAEKSAQRIVGSMADEKTGLPAKERAIQEQSDKQSAHAIHSAKEDALRRLKVASKVEQRGDRHLQSAKQAKTAVIGQDRELTPIGTDIRSDVNTRYESLKSARDETANGNITETNNAARAKEINGNHITDQPSYNKWMDELRGRLGMHPDATERSVTESGQLRQLTDIFKSLSVKEEKQIGGDMKILPPSFEALETVRRKLGDAARGGVEKGYDAIGQQEAGKLYDRLGQEMERFTARHDGTSPFRNYLNQYREMSKPLDVFETKTGQAAVGTEGFENNIFKTDPEGLASTYFKTPQTVARLKEMMGGGKPAPDPQYDKVLDRVSTEGKVSIPLVQRVLITNDWERAKRIVDHMESEGVVGKQDINTGAHPFVSKISRADAAVDRYASEYVSTMTRGKNAKQLEDWMRDPARGWLKSVPALEKRLGEYVDHLAQAERTGTRAADISKTLGTQATNAESLGQKYADSLKKDAQSGISLAQKRHIKDAIDKEMSSVKKTTALGVLFALPVTAMIPGGAIAEGGALAAEAVGAKQLLSIYKQDMRAAIDDILADPELIKLATAKNTPENVSVLKDALKKAGIGAAVSAAASHKK